METNMTTFTTTVTQMLTLPQEAGHTDVVVNVNYLVAGVDGTYTADIGFSQQFTIQQGEAFTPYAQLTQDQVVGWADPQTVSNMQACVQGQIDSMINPPVSPSSQPLPWSA
jgi:hypothetical protein